MDHYGLQQSPRKNNAFIPVGISRVHLVWITLSLHPEIRSRTDLLLVTSSSVSWYGQVSTEPPCRVLMSFVKLEKGKGFPLSRNPFEAGPKLTLRMCVNSAAAKESTFQIVLQPLIPTGSLLCSFELHIVQTPCFSKMSLSVQEWKPTLIPWEYSLPVKNEENHKQSSVIVTTA